jgi:hypothetical protein
VSLPFLTADGAHDDRPAHSDAHPVRPVGEQWRRPYSLGPWRVAAAALLLVLTAYLLFAALIVEAAGSGSSAGVMVVAGALVLAFTLRLLRVGLWVSHDGVRLVSLLRTRTLGWNDLGPVRTAQQPVRLLGLPRTVQGQALLLWHADGTQLPTLMTDHSLDFKGRAESFDVAADAIENWAAELRAH